VVEPAALVCSRVMFSRTCSFNFYVFLPYEPSGVPFFFCLATRVRGGLVSPFFPELSLCKVFAFFFLFPSPFLFTGRNALLCPTALPVRTALLRLHTPCHIRSTFSSSSCSSRFFCGCFFVVNGICRTPFSERGTDSPCVGPSGLFFAPCLVFFFLASLGDGVPGFVPGPAFLASVLFNRFFCFCSF